jgi:Tfp pilus assembly protein PilE
MSRAKVISVALIAILAAAAWWGYGEYRKGEQRKAIAALVSDTATRMSSALTATDVSPETARKLEEHSAAADRNLSELKRMNTAREPAFAEAADDYLLTSREILKRLVNVQRYRQLLSESLQALQAHMRADNRTGAWVQEAVKARERVNKDHRDLTIAVGVLEQLLQSFPASQKKVAPFAGPAVLIDDGVLSAARARALEAVKQATAEIAKTNQPDAFR